jgi:heptosyltransferase III
LAAQAGPREGATYADAVRNIEAAPLAGFFARGGDLDADWCEYFGGFNQVVSWLFDPDAIFEDNLKRAGVKHYVSAYAKISDEDHASVQLAQGLQRLALYLEDGVARLVPTAELRRLGAEWLAGNGVAGNQRIAVIHPGSGSVKKNWPIERWLELARRLMKEGDRVLVVGGEADYKLFDVFERDVKDVLFARDLPLPLLGAVLQRAGRYFGHDTGVSHLAAAVGVPSTVLFGPTDPAVWAPKGENVRVVMGPKGQLQDLAVRDVI